MGYLNLRKMLVLIDLVTFSNTLWGYQLHEGDESAANLDVTEESTFLAEWTPEDPVVDLDIMAVEMQPDGSSLVLGRTKQRGQPKLVVARFLSDDVPDLSFGNSGATYLDYPDGNFKELNLSADSDRIEIRGSICATASNCTAVFSALSLNGFLIKGLAPVFEAPR